MTSATEEKKKKSVLSDIMKYLIPLIITVGLCYVMFKSIDFHQMIDIIRHQCDFRWIGLAMLISIFSHVFRAFRWRIQLKALGVNSPRMILVYSIFGTYAVNLVFPRLGEVWRCGYISQRQDAPFATVFGSMVADRLADTITVACLLLLTFILASQSLLDYLAQNKAAYESFITLVSSPWLWIAVAACAVFAWWFLTAKAKEGSIMQKVQNFVKGLWEGFAVVLKMPGKGPWLLYTLCIWGCYFLQLYVAFYAFPFTREVLASHGTIVALVAFTLSSIAMGVPSNGGIGPWQWAIMFALDIYGVSRVDSGAFANLVLGSQTLLLILLGIITFVAIMLDKKNNKQLNTQK